MTGELHEAVVPTLGGRETFPKITDPIIKRAMQRGWQLVQEGPDGASFAKEINNARTYRVIMSVAREMDGRVWVHLSVSLVCKALISRTPCVVLPQWTSVTAVRDEFLGTQAKAVMVVAPASEHVNIEEVHHLWHCPEADPLPDFTRGTGSI